MAVEYSFGKQLVMSQGVFTSQDVEAILLREIPGAVSVRAAEQTDDRHGTDYWVKHARGADISVDVKIRREDWAAKPEPDRADDLALETWSVVEKRKIGWTRDSRQRTDYILWLWTDTGRWCLVPFAMLCAVFQEKWPEWSACYETREQYTPEYGGFHSQCVFVPRMVVWDEIYRRYSGIYQEVPA
jgi:hypothetical protein